jgi:hypothetical protein
MSRPVHFEHNRYLGDKRNQRVYDLDMYGADDVVTARVDAVLAAETFAVFGPDSLAEARNRGYRPDATLRRALDASDDEEA